MYNFFKKWTPWMMVFFTLIGMFINYDNSNMINAYLTGFTGWLVVAVDGLFLNKGNSQNES